MWRHSTYCRLSLGNAIKTVWNTILFWAANDLGGPAQVKQPFPLTALFVRELPVNACKLAFALLGFLVIVCNVNTLLDKLVLVGGRVCRRGMSWRMVTFNLGLLQAMHRSGFLKYVDYLSTVSGGRYIGSCLSWLKIIGRYQFPFGNSRKDYSGIGGRVLAWLRCHGQYLTPGDGLTVWALIAACITGVAVNILIVMPVFPALFYLLTRDLFTCPEPVAGFMALSDCFFLIF